jgi:hypothetical protein
MNYFFLYQVENGTLYGSPYLGETEEWTNIPSGCGAIGPFPEDHVTASDAYVNPDCYNVQNGTLTPVATIDQIKEKKLSDLSKLKSMPNLEDRISSLEAATLSLMGL